jgi:hypothetical protein
MLMLLGSIFDVRCLEWYENRWCLECFEWHAKSLTHFCLGINEIVYYIWWPGESRGTGAIIVLGGVAVGHRFEPQSDLELFSAIIVSISTSKITALSRFCTLNHEIFENSGQIATCLWWVGLVQNLALAVWHWHYQCQCASARFWTDPSVVAIVLCSSPVTLAIFSKL